MTAADRARLVAGYAELFARMDEAYPLWIEVRIAEANGFPNIVAMLKPRAYAAKDRRTEAMVRLKGTLDSLGIGSFVEGFEVAVEGEG